MLSRHRLAVAAAAACLSLLSGGSALELTVGRAQVSLGAAAQAQAAISPEEVTGYAASVLQMDAPRNEAYSQIKTLLTGTSQDISSIDMSCAGTANLNQLPRNLRSSVRTIVVDYCNQASSIVQANGLTVRQFNAITTAYPQDPALASQIRDAMVQLQQQSANGSE
ncbi:MAG TPA: DUF4168 domain-containing protein [Nodosilinea sp.]|nr:DUF4168 domain-containing protein [Nodosilinea sp.]